MILSKKELVIFKKNDIIKSRIRKIEKNENKRELEREQEGELHG